MHRKTRTLNAKTIAAAKRGNVAAMEKILDYFRPKLVKKATLTMYDCYGMPHAYINRDLLDRLERRVIWATIEYSMKPRSRK